MNATDIRGYSYEAGVHCIACTSALAAVGILKRVPPLILASDENGIAQDLQDREGNPVHPIFADQGMSDDTCDDCGEELP